MAKTAKNPNQERDELAEAQLKLVKPAAIEKARQDGCPTYLLGTDYPYHTLDGRLAHAFSDHVVPYVLSHIYSLNCGFNQEESRSGFISSIEELIASDYPTILITKEQLQELKKVAGQDWGDLSTIKAISQKYHELIRDSTYNEAQAFQKVDLSGLVASQH